MTISHKNQISPLPVLCLFLLPGSAGSAQTRMNDEDVERTMKNLKEDSQRFQSTFNSAISKSTVRKTSQEREYKNIVKTFRDQTEAMLNAFQDRKRADTTLPGVLDTAKRIDGVLRSVQLGEHDRRLGEMQSGTQGFGRSF
jgi:hypothetical protein